MIFIQDNVYLKRELKFDDVKPRLLGQSIHPMKCMRNQSLR